jgi:2-polyprenyl-6-hydroxyphenyl methylase/3-demethylubiquinone-9 3-methyltransferase
MYFADTVGRAEDEQYYEEVWSAQPSHGTPYSEKRRAVEDTNLERLFSTLPRFGWARSMLRSLPAGSRVFDAGCGEGALLWAAQRLGHDVWGCDLSREAVGLAKTLLRTNNIVQGVLGCTLPVNGTFDCVCALEVLEHVPNPAQFVADASSLLRPRGTLLLTTPNYHRFFTVAKRALGYRHSSTDYPPHHLTRWTRRGLTRLLSRSFEVVEVSSLAYGAETALSRAGASFLHSATFRQMGQTLSAIAVKSDHPARAIDHGQDDRRF